jgi:hypothetical protein
VLSAVVKPKFSAVQEHCHTKLLATRYSLPFRLGRNFAFPFFSGYATFENLPKFLPAEGDEGDAP